MFPRSAPVGLSFAAAFVSVLLLVASAPAAAQAPAAATASFMDSVELPVEPTPVDTPRTDSLSLSLEASVERVMQESEEVRMARVGVDEAGAQVTAARSSELPQIDANLGYTRTLASIYDTGGGPSLPDSLAFSPDPTAPLEERVSYLEQNVTNASLGSVGSIFGDLPFGRENAYAATLNASQVLFAGGRLRNGVKLAHDVQKTALINLERTKAAQALQVRASYYQALLTRQVVAISAAALEQAERFLENVRLRYENGRASELEVLRAEVEMENLRPQLVKARNAAELAELDLKRLTNLPPERPLRLTTELTKPPAAALADPRLSPEARAVQETALRAAERQVNIRNHQQSIAKGSFWPTISLSTSYGAQRFPSDVLDVSGDWREDWTISFGIQVPVFQGLQRKADLEEAQAGVVEARLQRDQLQEAVRLQREQALSEKRRAASLITARERTVDQAQRVYDLTVMRYERGIATQLEVDDARLALLQARTNLAQALTDFYTADAQLAQTLGGTSSGRTGTPSPPTNSSSPTRSRAGSGSAPSSSYRF